MSKINSKQARPATAAEMKVFFENSLDFSIFHAKLNTIVMQLTIDTVSWSNKLLVAKRNFFYVCIFELLREASNGCCRLVRWLHTDRKSSFNLQAKEI